MRTVARIAIALTGTVTLVAGVATPHVHAGRSPADSMSATTMARAGVAKPCQPQQQTAQRPMSPDVVNLERGEHRIESKQATLRLCVSCTSGGSLAVNRRTRQVLDNTVNLAQEPPSGRIPVVIQVEHVVINFNLADLGW